MAGDYDPTLKVLVEVEPASWLPLVGRPPAPVSPIDADISTILSGAMDKLLRVRAGPDYLLHLDFQAGHDSARLPRRLRLYNAAQGYRHRLPVFSNAVLLYPGADSPQLTGVHEERLPGEEPFAVFRYGVIRVWQLSAERLLAGGLGTLPLAPISDVSEADLPDMIGRMRERLQRHDARTIGPELWVATEVLLGLRYSSEFAEALLRGVREMKESVTYQAIVAEGARRILLVTAEGRFGRPSAAARAALEAIKEPEPLEELAHQVPRVNSWEELLGLPASRRRSGGRRRAGP
jgi:predicted transposase YdaD